MGNYISTIAKPRNMSTESSRGRRQQYDRVDVPARSDRERRQDTEARRCDHDALNVGRALVDLGDACVAEQALHVKVVGIAGTAVDLEALVSGGVARRRCRELGLRRLEAAALTLVAQLCRAPCQQA